MQQAVEENKPFYVNVWPDDVHSPFFPPVEKWGETKRDLYLAVLEEMDRQFDPLFTYLKADEKLRNNTLVLICSDNGPEPGAGRAGHLKGYKTHLYEGGIRSPLIVWGPGLLTEGAAGARNRTSVLAAIDLVPSLLRLAGVVGPDSVVFDGEDLLSTLLGSMEASRRAPLFFSRPPDRKDFYGFENLPDMAVRDGNWKLLCDYDGGRPQLYNLEDDPGESRNVAVEHPDIVRKLTDNTMAWWQSVRNSEEDKNFIP
jgi:uncharacterized sulfatase